MHLAEVTEIDIEDPQRIEFLENVTVVAKSRIRWLTLSVALCDGAFFELQDQLIHDMMVEMCRALRDAG